MLEVKSVEKTVDGTDIKSYSSVWIHVMCHLVMHWTDKDRQLFGPIRTCSESVMQLVGNIIH